MPRGVIMLAVMVAVGGAAGPALADTLAYVRATSFAPHTDESKYHPLNLADDDPTTVWCEGNDGRGEGEEVTYFFKRPQRIDRVIITPSPHSDPAIQSIRFSDGYRSVDLNVGDVVVEKSFAPPMQGKEYTITITRVAPGTTGPLRSCLADVMLYWKKRPFGGRTPPSALRYNRYQDRLLGVWNGGPMGAPEKTLTFALDGTWSWTYSPLMGGKSRKMSGEYRFRGNRLLMRKGETGRWSDMRFKWEDKKAAPNDPTSPLNDYRVLTFNDALGALLAGEYNNGKF